MHPPTLPTHNSGEKKKKARAAAAHHGMETVHQTSSLPVHAFSLLAPRDVYAVQRAMRELLARVTYVGHTHGWHMCVYKQQQQQIRAWFMIGI